MGILTVKRDSGVVKRRMKLQKVLQILTVNEDSEVTKSHGNFDCK